MAEESLQSAWRTINLHEWKVEKSIETGDIVHSKIVRGKKLFKLTVSLISYSALST